MATMRRPRYSLRDSLYWDETECLTYYGMLSLHEMFEVVGSQLTETDVEVLSFLLDETYPAGGHPLDPAGWTSEPGEEDPEASKGVSPSPVLLEAWRRLQPKVPALACPTAARHKPKSGLELLLELERRGYLSEGNLEPLLQLLRVLTRHDLLPLVSRKKRRTVSPERFRVDYGTEDKRQVCTSGLTDPCAQTESHDEHATQQWRGGVDSARPTPAPLRKKRGKGRRWTSKPTSHRRRTGIPETPPPPIPEKVTCDIRLRVRAEYWEHESALRGGVSSDKQQPLERQFELFSRATSVLRARDLGSIICDIKFSELDNLEAFWGDYLSGALLEALKGVFITDSLRRVAGSEGVRLLISVDQDDYEEGRRLLLDAQEQQAGCWGRDRPNLRKLVMDVRL
uniref:DNA-binding death effector domain-containing protein 2-like isoform X1 n=1 Tax=Oncorhynchus gorbuscha TaxID=8017 RepID=UPI001EAECBCE|nr:DNA-binding death effector domain-containing protein 2-like isoform X1 [Oncorhynchus gorbuscha]